MLLSLLFSEILGYIFVQRLTILMKYCEVNINIDCKKGKVVWLPVAGRAGVRLLERHLIADECKIKQL